MNDLLPAEAERWERLEAGIIRRLKSYGYRPVRAPIVESTRLFTRAIGEMTDIVEKEMYSFTDQLNGEELTLRPEGTAGCARAVIEHDLARQSAQRLYYMGAMFRHERPQKGRYRQFHQIGAETFGFPGPDIDAELMLLTARLWRDFGLNLTLQINTLGRPEERARHRADLIRYLEARQSALDEDAKRRLHDNPLRILDSKNPAMEEVCAGAPRLFDYLGSASREHFAGLEAMLTAAGVPYTVNPRLVRGLDYYNLTVFEWVTDQLGAQGTVCAGGRYDGLVEQLGGKPTPACGFALGLERMIALLPPDRCALPDGLLDAYVAHCGENDGAKTLPLAITVAEMLRERGLKVILHCGSGSFKAQMKRADASGALYAVIIGDNEAAKNAAIIKPLRHEAAQTEVALDQLGDTLCHALEQIARLTRALEDTL
jgi:histidyl-tRNA synthetase